MSWCFSGNSWNFFSTRLQHSSPPPFTFVFVWPKSFPLCPRVSMGLSVEWTRKPLPGGRSLARRVPRRPRHVRGHQPRNASRRPRPSHCWIPLRPLWIHPVNLSSFNILNFPPPLQPLLLPWARKRWYCGPSKWLLSNFKQSPEPNSSVKHCVTLFPNRFQHSRLLFPSEKSTLLWFVFEKKNRIRTKILCGYFGRCERSWLAFHALRIVNVF